MHSPNILGFRHFYSSPLGALCCRGLRSKLREIWPVDNNPFFTQQLQVMGLGYAQPLLTAFLPKTGGLTCSPPLALTPGWMGAYLWPIGNNGATNLSVLTSEISLPLQEQSCDRIVVMHLLEFTEHPAEMLHEIVRVLTPLGKVVFIVPNRLGRWARSASTPFGYGTPFSPLQLEQLLDHAGLSISQSRQALYFPPTQRRALLKLFGWSRHLLSRIRVGSRDARMLPRLMGGGVLLVEAEKQQFAYLLKPKPAKSSLLTAGEAVSA